MEGQPDIIWQAIKEANINPGWESDLQKIMNFLDEYNAN